MTCPGRSKTVRAGSEVRRSPTRLTGHCRQAQPHHRLMIQAGVFPYCPCYTHGTGYGLVACSIFGLLEPE